MTTTFAEIIRKFTGSDFSELPETALNRFREMFGNLFSDIGYVRDGIHPFNSIIEWMARFQIATITEKLVNQTEDEDFISLYGQEIKGKKFRLPKGLMLSGGYGTGKTLAARIIAERFGLEMIDTYKISFQYQKKDGNDWIEKWLYSNCKNAVIIDDVGAEGDIKKFGNESPIGAILATRARFWEQYGTPTIYTTNITTAEELASKYSSDKRLMGRLDAYHVAVKFSGASRRK